MDVTSVVGEGSTFRVTLPLAPDTDAPRPRRSSPIRGVDVAGGTERGLVAEDEPAIRSADARILGAARYAFLQKPFTARDIMLAVRTALDAG